MDSFARLEDVPSDYLAIVIKEDVGFIAARIHLDRNGQPFTLANTSRQYFLMNNYNFVSKGY